MMNSEQYKPFKDIFDDNCNWKILFLKAFSWDPPEFCSWDFQEVWPVSQGVSDPPRPPSTSHLECYPALLCGNKVTAQGNHSGLRVWMPAQFHTQFSKVKPEHCSQWAHAHGPPVWVIHRPRRGVGSTFSSISKCQCMWGLHGTPTPPPVQTSCRRERDLSVQTKGEVLASSNSSCAPLLTSPSPSPKGIPIGRRTCSSHLNLTGKEVGTSGEEDRIHGGKKQEEEEWKQR